jgi:ZIP family zinc transporter
MNFLIARGLLIPFLGTSLGAALVFFMKRELDLKLQNMLSGFAAGVMVAASVWSLLIPSMEMVSDRGKLAFVPAAVGFCAGMIFLLILDKVIPHMHLDESEEGPKSNLQKTTMMVLAVTLHNIPEGMAVGILYAGWASGSAQITEAGALTLALGIAIQNFPEGAIISMPLHSKGLSKAKSCWYGVLSGIVEPVAGFLTILLASHVMSILPYFLSFAAGAMIFVVVEELVPEMAEGEHSNLGTIMFMMGFVLMMILDVALG